MKSRTRIRKNSPGIHKTSSKPKLLFILFKLNLFIKLYGLFKNKEKGLYDMPVPDPNQNGAKQWVVPLPDVVGGGGGFRWHR
jgi:hypothetical protein